MSSYYSLRSRNMFCFSTRVSLMNSQHINLKKGLFFHNRLRGFFSLYLCLECVQECHLSFFRKLGSKTCFYSEMIACSVCVFTCVCRGQGRVGRRTGVWDNMQAHILESTVRLNSHWIWTKRNRYCYPLQQKSQYKWCGEQRCIVSPTWCIMHTCLNFQCVINNQRWYWLPKLPLKLIQSTAKKSNTYLNWLIK